MTSLEEWQISVGGLVLGPGTPFRVYDLTADTDLTTVDKPGYASDGVRFGRDYRGSSTHTLEAAIDAENAENALAHLSQIKSVWRGDSVRSTPGAVMTLRYKRPGRDSLTYGRPRKFAVSGHENTSVGYIAVTAEWVGADDLWYDAEETQTAILARPSSVGGFTAPFTVPWTAANAAPPSDNLVVVGGDVSTWSCFDLHGPISAPKIEVMGKWVISMPTLSLGANRVLTIDPRPWARSVLTDEGVSKAGAFNSSSPKLSQLKLEPGQHVVKFSGVDVTGTSWVAVRHRAAYSDF